MAQYDETTFEGIYNNPTTGSFKTTGLRAILAATMRQFTTDIKDSFLNSIDDLPIVFNTVSTASGTLTFNCGGANLAILALPTSFATPKTVALSNDTRARKIDFSFQITNVAAVLTFPAAFLMSDVRWDSGGKTWTPIETGKYTGEAVYDGTNWYLTISQSVFV